MFGPGFDTVLCVHSCFAIIRGRLDLAVLFTPSTLNRQNQKTSALELLCWRTPEYSIFQGVVEQSRDLFQKMAEHCLHCAEIFFSLSR